MGTYMTTQELVNGHKFRNPTIERLVREYADNETVDPSAYTTEELTTLLCEFAKDRARWAKSNAVAAARAKAGRKAEANAKATYLKFGGKSVKATLTDAERAEWEAAKSFLDLLGYDVG